MTQSNITCAHLVSKHLEVQVFNTYLPLMHCLHSTTWFSAEPCCWNKHFYSHTDTDRNPTMIPNTMAIVGGEAVRGEQQANELICCVNKGMCVTAPPWHVAAALRMESRIRGALVIRSCLTVISLEKMLHAWQKNVCRKLNNAAAHSEHRSHLYEWHPAVLSGRGWDWRHLLFFISHNMRADTFFCTQAPHHFGLYNTNRHF